MKFKALPVTSLEDATVDFEQLSTLSILNETSSTVLHAPTGTMVSRTRVFGTAYQPNTSRSTFVIVTLNASPAGVAAVLMDAANPPTTQIAEFANGSANAAGVFAPVSFIVPAGFFYKLSLTAGTVAVVSTFEYAL